ncbi:MAG TPA: hypothetical protein VJ978_01830 [Nitriliruptoraceae bacterium]|nr:hypothetical protein [Nitriliruptoraceae bacterium]
MTDTTDLLPGQARDIVAFGHETGRVMSNGAIVGRSEPFAKVFASSRAVKRKVGVTAWAILEDIALDATVAPRGVKRTPGRTRPSSRRTGSLSARTPAGRVD